MTTSLRPGPYLMFYRTTACNGSTNGNAQPHTLTQGYKTGQSMLTGSIVFTYPHLLTTAPATFLWGHESFGHRQDDISAVIWGGCVFLWRRAGVSLHYVSFDRVMEKAAPLFNPLLPLNPHSYKQVKRNLISPTSMPAETAKFNSPNNQPRPHTLCCFEFAGRKRIEPM